MIQASYQMSPVTELLLHFPSRAPLVRDGIRPSDNAANDTDDYGLLALQARVRSGDYIATLATELDKLAQGLAAENAPETSQVEKLAAELLYVDENYCLIKKTH